MVNDINTNIYVAMHKPDDYVLKVPYSYYTPIHCGKAIYEKDPDNKEFLPEFGDDTGDNISNKNRNYCELTAMYWIWKNDKSKPDDIVGLNHYRRYFAEPLNLTKMLSKETIIELLQSNDFLINGCGTDVDHTTSDDESVYNQYILTHNKVDIDNALIGIKKLFLNLYDKMEHEIMHSGAMCLCNMLITKKKYFDEYCEFLFPVLAYVESTIDFTKNEYQGYSGRVFSFLGERLLRPWLKATGYSGKQTPSLDWEKYSGYIWT